MDCLRRHCIVLAAMAFGAVSPAAAQPDIALAKLADRYWDAQMEHSPTWATALGDDRFNDRLEDVSDEARRRWESTLNALLHDLRRVYAGWLSPEERLTDDLLERSLRDDVLRVELRPEYSSLDPLYGPQIRFPLILVSQPFRNADDFRNYIARLRAFGQQVTDTISSLRDGVALGWVSPRIIVEKVIPQIRAQIVRDVTKSTFYAPVKKVSILDEADRAPVTAEIAQAIASDVVPAFLELLAYVEDDYLPACRTTVGIGSLPNGAAMYRALVRLHTSVSIEPDEVHRIGLEEVARIRGEMAKIQKELGISGTLDEFLVQVRSDTRQRFRTSDELYAEANRLLQRTKPLMRELFGRLPRADCVLKEMEPFRAAAAPMAYYNQAAEDGSRPGYFYVNTHEPQERLRFTLEALTYHEAIPGHHLQSALDQENGALPEFRRHGSYTAYVEGWALYAEKLGYEIGGYRTPYARLGQLTFEIWRACRLVVDTGIHWKGWSRQQAIDYLAANTCMTLFDIETEVDRYIAWPGQALAYKIGELRILDLRHNAERTLGDRFDLRAFHDALLAGGAMPIDVLEQRMNAWIASQAK